MQNFLTMAFNCVTRNANSIVAISSLVIAICSLYLTFQSRKEDRAYKEMMIRPSLLMVAETKDFSVAIENQGLGPARIKNIVYQFGDECLSLIKADGVHVNIENYDKVGAGILALLHPIFHEIISSIKIPVVTNVEDILLPGTIIGPGKKVVLYKVGRASLDVFHKNMATLDMKSVQSLSHRFVLRAARLPIYFTYCSMSGQFCETVRHEQAGYQSCKLDN